MKRQPFFSVLVTLCLAACAASPAQDGPDGPSPPASRDTSAFAAWLASFRQENAIASLSVVVLRDGEVILESYLGHQDDEFDLPTTAATTYFVASVTKPIAGTALFIADETDVFDLDRPVTDAPRWRDSFCQWFPSSGIIFAGATLGDTVIAPFSCDNLTFRHVINMHANGTPGTSFLYNPIAFANLSRAFEDLAPTSFRTYLHDTVLAPAAMRDTAAGWRDRIRAHVLTDLAMPHAVRDGKLVKQALPDDDFRAAAGLYMTPLDLARFDRALDQDALLTADQRQRMWTPPTRPDGRTSVYAHGWYVQDLNGERLVWHGGWEPGKYSAIYVKVPSRSVTLIALANTEGLHWGNPLTDARVHESPLVDQFLREVAGVGSARASD
ncbi:MAG: serine hydrolase domain-containing protein [Pseudomonadota bacterium]